MRTLLLAATAAALLPATAQAAPATGRLLVTYDQDARPQARAAAADLVDHAGVRVAGPVVPDLGLVTVRPEAGTSPHAAAERLRAQPGVARVEVEHRATLRYQPNDPALTQPETASGTPAGTPVQWWAQRTGLFGAWDITRGDGATVAVIDSGLDSTHPELAGKVAAYYDVDGTAGHGPATQDENGHGTHVASLACGAGDDGVGIVGAGFNCRLLVFKSDLSDASVAAAIDEAVKAGADAINMSFGTDVSEGADAVVAPTVVRQALEQAAAKGVVLVSAGADTPIEEQGYPSNVLQPTGTGGDISQGIGLSVTAADFSDQRANYAGRGTQISLAAYGAFNPNVSGPAGLLGDFPVNRTELEQTQTFPDGTVVPPCGCRTRFNADSRYAYLQGTSMAAPIVAGTAAMVRHLNPDLSAREIVFLLKQTARRPAGQWTGDLGWGILDAGAAMVTARSADRRAPTSNVVRPKLPKRASRVTVKLVGADAGPAGVTVSGVAKWRVYRRIGTAKPVLVATTTKPTARVNLRRGALNALYSVAVDKAGNVEAPPAKPDVRLRVPKLKR